MLSTGTVRYLSVPWTALIALRVEVLVVNFVQESPLNESLSEAEKKAKMYYVSCLDVNRTVEKLGAAPLLNLMREFGGWAVSASAGVWNESAWNLQTTLERIHSLGLSNFFSVWVGEDEKNPTSNILQVSDRCGHPPRPPPSTAPVDMYFGGSCFLSPVNWTVLYYI